VGVWVTRRRKVRSPARIEIGAPQPPVRLGEKTTQENAEQLRSVQAHAVWQQVVDVAWPFVLA